MSEKYLLRSLMFMPGNNERLMKSATCDADCLLPDIEDSVQPFSEKLMRKLIKSLLKMGCFLESMYFLESMIEKVVA